MLHLGLITGIVVCELQDLRVLWAAQRERKQEQKEKSTQVTMVLRAGLPGGRAS
jgi:hypothetical protein